MAATGARGAVRRTGNLPCGDDLFKQNTALRALVHRREVEGAELRARIRDLEAEVALLRAMRASDRAPR